MKESGVRRTSNSTLSFIDTLFQYTLSIFHLLNFKGLVADVWLIDKYYNNKGNGLGGDCMMELVISRSRIN
jgi:hypothetical protein